MVEKIVLAALILLPVAGIAADPPPVRNGNGAVRLEEIRITGAPEHPGVLFFLPRARFRLLPLRTGEDGKDPLPAEDRERRTPAR